MSSKKKTTKQPTIAQVEKYLKKHAFNESDMGLNRLKKTIKTIHKSSLSPNTKKRKTYTLLRETKVKDPNTGKERVRHGTQGQDIIRKVSMKILTTRVNNTTINNNNKGRLINNAMKRFGISNVGTLLHGKAKPPILRKARNKTWVRSGRLANADKIRKELESITGGHVTLPQRTHTLGEGAAGLAVTCISNKKCDKKYKDAVLKISKADDEWINEVKFLNKLTKYMEDNPKKDPLAPRIFGSFKIGNQGFILMQHAKKVYPKAIIVGEWKQVARKNSDKLKLLGPLETAMKRLHKEVGMMHGNMHPGNVWFATIPDKRSKFGFVVKAYFADFGRSANYNKAKKFKPATYNHRYGRIMWKPIKLSVHPNINENLMDDDDVLKEYKNALKYTRI